MQIETKTEAAKLFGGKMVQLAKALGLTKSSISEWPDDLDTSRSDRVVGAAVRLGVVKLRSVKK